MTILDDAIQYIQSGNLDKGRDLLEQLLEENDKSEAVWFWLSRVVESNTDRMICLENVLEINPENVEARQRLQELLDLEETATEIAEHTFPEFDNVNIGVSPSNSTNETRKTTEKVLYIDDSPDRIKLVQLILERKRNDIELQIVSGIQEGIKITQQELPALIIICSYISDGNAWAFLYLVDNDKALSNVPIIALGGRFDHWKGDLPQVSFNSPQPNVVLSMPFLVDEFLQAVEQYLPAPSQL